MKSSTIASFLKEHRVALDAKYRAKYPLGKFCIQNHGGWKIHWCPSRNTSHCSKRGISVLYKDTAAPAPAIKTSKYNPDGVQHENYQNCCFGKVYNYSSLESLLAACRKKCLPQELVDAFVLRYNDRKSESFTL